MKKYIAMIKRDFKRGRIFDALCLIVPPLVMTLILLLFAVWVIAKISTLIFSNIDSILGCGIVLIGFIFYFRHSSEIHSAMSAEQKKKTIQQNLSSNYDIIGNLVYEIVRQHSSLLKVEKPMRQQDIETTTQTTCKGEIVLYQYILYKTSDFDVNTMKILFEQLIKHQVKKGGLKGFYQYGDVLRPILMVESIEEYNGYYLLNMTLATQNYLDTQTNIINTNLASGVEERIIYDDEF